MVIRYNDFVKALEKLLIADYDINVYVTGRRNSG